MKAWMASSTGSVGGGNAGFPVASVRPWEALVILLKNRGARYEGDVFSVLRNESFVLRAYEFAVADGALDCTQAFNPESTYAD